MSDLGFEPKSKKDEIKFLKTHFKDYLLSNTVTTQLELDSEDLLQTGFKELITTIVLPTAVLGAARPRTGRFGIYLPEPYRSFKSVLTEVMRESILKCCASTEMLRNAQAIHLDTTYYNKPPKSYSKMKCERIDNRPKITKPDIDNCDKTILDSLAQTGCILDDKIVSEISSRKLWSLEHGNKTIVKIRNLQLENF